MNLWYYADFLSCKLMHILDFGPFSKTKILALTQMKGSFGFGFLPPGYGFE